MSWTDPWSPTLRSSIKFAIFETIPSPYRQGDDPIIPLVRNHAETNQVAGACGGPRWTWARQHVASASGPRHKNLLRQHIWGRNTADLQLVSVSKITCLAVNYGSGLQPSIPLSLLFLGRCPRKALQRNTKKGCKPVPSFPGMDILHGAGNRIVSQSVFMRLVAPSAHGGLSQNSSNGRPAQAPKGIKRGAGGVGPRIGDCITTSTGRGERPVRNGFSVDPSGLGHVDRPTAG